MVVVHVCTLARIGYHAMLDEEEGRLFRAGLAAQKMFKALAQGQNVLVNCAHGVHRTGSMIVLWMSLPKHMPSSKEDWHRILRSGYEDFARGRGLQARATHRHDYEQEVGPHGTLATTF
jgi:hypothetical protein